MHSGSDRLLARIVLSALMFMVVAMPAVSKEGDPLAEGKERHLNGHGFLPSIYISDPFVSSTFQNYTGGGMAMDLQTNFRNLDDEVIYTFTGDLVFASLGMGYQQKLGTRWAVGALFSGQARTGTNASSFLTEGADVVRQAEFWATYRLKRTEKSQASLGMDWKMSNVTFFTPGDFARYISDGGELEEAPLVTTDKTWTTQITFNWAHAFSPKFGLRFNGSAGVYEVPATSGVYKGSHRLGILGEMDLKKPDGGLPLGLTLGYTLALPDDDVFTGLSGALLGFWYTGKEAFIIGAETGFMTMPIANQESDSISAQFIVFTIRYYF